MDDLIARIVALPGGGRRLVALAGPPASGKSTRAEALAKGLVAAGRSAVVVPMDGYHLDNRVLEARGLRPRKGAPETFDARGFLRLIADIARGGEVIYPLFDRSRDLAVAGAGVVPEACDLVVVEGNYLLFDAPIWRDLAPFWDCSVFLEVPEDVLRARLMQRWLDHGFDQAAAQAKAEENDLPNARRVLSERLPADLTMT